MKKTQKSDTVYGELSLSFRKPGKQTHHGLSVHNRLGADSVHDRWGTDRGIDIGRLAMMAMSDHCCRGCEGFRRKSIDVVKAFKVLFIRICGGP